MLYPKATHRLPHPGLCEPLQDANEEPLDHSWSGSLFLHPKKFPLGQSNVATENPLFIGIIWFNIVHSGYD